MKKFGRILMILLLLVVVASCFVACGEISKHTYCPGCGKRINYAAWKSGKFYTCSCGTTIQYP
jgi:hypothetical protein